MRQCEQDSLADLFTAEVWQVLSRRLCLSPREIQIIERLFDDEKEINIARKLGISPHTVRTHLERMRAKLHAGSRAALLITLFRELIAATVERGSLLPPICARRRQGTCRFQD